MHQLRHCGRSFLSLCEPAPGQQHNVPVQTATISGNVLPADTPQQASIPQLQERNPRDHIQNGDTISLNFRFTPQFDTTASVQPDGYIGLREIFKAEGLDRARAQSGAADQSKTLNDPVLSARTDFVKPYFTVSGKVSTPSKYDLHGDTTVAECIAIGFTVAAKHSQVLVFQQKNFDWVEVHKVNVKRMLHSHDLAEDNRSASAPLADNIL